MDDLCLKGIALKRSQSWGIANLATQPQELEIQRKPPKRRAFCDSPGFFISFINANDRISLVKLANTGQT
jgi:hypothetical protein